MNSENINLLPCPFCGHQLDADDPDTIYPNGSGWKITEGIRHYVSCRSLPREQWCHSVHCPTPSGGCGAQISGDSIKEAVDKWNQRADYAGNPKGLEI